MLSLVGPLVLVGLALVLIYLWWSYRQSHSITDDAFVEAHIINVAPQTVSGRIVRFLVEENDRVEQGQLLAEIDPTPYRDQVNIARSKVDIARAELRRQEEALARLRQEVPIQIEIARRSLAAAEAEQARAKEAIKLTKEEVEKTIEEAQAGLEAAKADLVLAQQEYTRYTRLQQQEAAPLRRAQQVTQARDAAEAHKNLAVAKLAKAEADRTRINVATRTHEAAEKATQKAVQGVSLAQTGNVQIREAELLTAVKKEEVEDARLNLTAAEDKLHFTQIRAPFPGIVVKRFRHLGDFVSPGVSILSMYNPELIYVTAYLEEDRLPGVAPGNSVELRLDAFDKPFRGRVVWLNKATGAQFALMPRNVVSGEFTKVVQRVPVRIAIEKDERWPLLRAGLSVQARITHGGGDPQWAEQEARRMRELETRFNRPQE
ncbi:MAG TPA: HlyD family secretion protein [Acidobacteriaceae bacterium]|nr:HlyD family secretion protein [Acidobacteriaceae bacterium]